MVHSIFQNVNKTNGISIILECPIDILNVNHNNSMFANPFRTLNVSTNASQIGMWCSGTKKCSQKYEINHFCLGIFSAIRPSEITPEIPPGIPLELCLEIHLEIRFEIPLEIRCEIPPEIPPRMPLELSLELHLEIRFEIPPAIPLEIPDGIFQIVISNAF